MVAVYSLALMGLESRFVLSTVFVTYVLYRTGAIDSILRVMLERELGNTVFLPVTMSSFSMSLHYDNSKQAPQEEPLAWWFWMYNLLVTIMTCPLHGSAVLTDVRIRRPVDGRWDVEDIVVLATITTRFRFWWTAILFIVSGGGFIYVDRITVDGMKINIEGWEEMTTGELILNVSLIGAGHHTPCGEGVRTTGELDGNDLTHVADDTCHVGCMPLQLPSLFPLQTTINNTDTVKSKDSDSSSRSGNITSNNSGSGVFGRWAVENFLASSTQREGMEGRLKGFWEQLAAALPVSKPEEAQPQLQSPSQSQSQLRSQSQSAAQSETQAQSEAQSEPLRLALSRHLDAVSATTATALTDLHHGREAVRQYLAGTADKLQQTWSRQVGDWQQEVAHFRQEVQQFQEDVSARGFLQATQAALEDAVVTARAGVEDVIVRQLQVSTTALHCPALPCPALPCAAH